MTKEDLIELFRNECKIENIRTDVDGDKCLVFPIMSNLMANTHTSIIDDSFEIRVGDTGWRKYVISLFDYDTDKLLYIFNIDKEQCQWLRNMILEEIEKNQNSKLIQKLSVLDSYIQTIKQNKNESIH